MDIFKNKQVPYYILILIGVVAGMWALQAYASQSFSNQPTEVTYRQFLSELESGQVDSVLLGENDISYTLQGNETEDGEPATFTTVPVEDPELVTRLLEAGVEFEALPAQNGSALSIFSAMIPLIPLVIIGYLFYRRLGDSAAGPGNMPMGKSKAQQIPGELTGVKFSDVGGAEEVAVELKEIIEFLQDPERFTRMGARLPKGVLLVGPPGTGKTLLAKAVAGEAGVPFFSISGSDFVEMFVGVGAARVRKMFEDAKTKAPCIIFIDEIDAIGQARASGTRLGTNDEREQTLNQLLAEMDGFVLNQGIIIIGATNRPEILDPALLRPGRFDRQVQVSLPTERGRREILAIHTRSVKLSENVNLDRISQITPGFSGADLANIVNEAALLAVRSDREAVIMDDFDLAIERVVAGLQRKMPLRNEVKRKVAYHEAGHALVAQLLTHTDPVHKVSIIPTAKGALGYTLQMPEEDQYLIGDKEIKERMAVMMGGRVAELIIFEEPSTGAANDLERVTEMARRMITEFGMTEALGPVRYVANVGMGGNFLSNRLGLRDEISPETATLIDREIRRLVEEAQDRALQILQINRAALDEVANVLMEREVISGDDIRRIAAELGQETLSGNEVALKEVQAGTTNENTNGTSKPGATH